MHPKEIIVCYAARLAVQDAPALASAGEEAEASMFAAELLMPSADVRAATVEFAGTRPEGEYPVPRDELVNELAAHC